MGSSLPAKRRRASAETTRFQRQGACGKQPVQGKNRCRQSHRSKIALPETTRAAMLITLLSNSALLYTLFYTALHLFLMPKRRVRAYALQGNKPSALK